MALLDSSRDEFADRNVLLHLVLGLVSYARRVGALVPLPAPVEAPPEGAGSAPPDAALSFLLGVIAVRATLMRELDPLRAERDQRRATTPETRGGEPFSAAIPGPRELSR
jgi:hypothetical protein